MAFSGGTKIVKIHFSPTPNQQKKSKKTLSPSNHFYIVLSSFFSSFYTTDEVWSVSFVMELRKKFGSYFVNFSLIRALIFVGISPNDLNFSLDYFCWEKKCGGSALIWLLKKKIHATQFLY
jgi:hypothetical protein